MTSPLAGAVQVTCRGFPASTPNALSVAISEAALDRAAIGVGNLNAFTFGAPSTVRAIAQQWRTAITRDSIELRDGQWLRSDQYNNLERTEKGFMSGLLGGVISKLIAESVFGIQYFGHIEYFPTIEYVPENTRRPDFLGIPAAIGQAPVIVESKGRSGHFRGYSNEIAGAKAQVASVLSIPRHVAPQRYVQYTHFDDGVLCADLYDPPGPVSDQADDTRPRIDLRDYYLDVVDTASALEATRVSDLGGVDYRVFSHRLLNIAVGIPETIFQAVQQKRPLPVGSGEIILPDRQVFMESAQTWWQEIGSPRDGNKGRIVSDVGPDGVAVVGTYPQIG